MQANVLRIHYTFSQQEGAEYDILKTMEVMHTHLGTEKHLVLISEEGRNYMIGRYDSEERSIATIEGVRTYLRQYTAENRIEIINVHSMPYRRVTEAILSLDLPVVRSLHEPMITCPGWARFLTKSATPCKKQFGPLCLVQAYLQKCQRSRKPLNVLSAYFNVLREQRDFIKRYTLLLVYSDYMTGILKQHGVPAEKIVKVPSPQMLAIGKITSLPKTGIPRLIFAGRISKQKGVHILFAAYSKLIALHGSSVGLDIVGQGEMLDELKAQAKRALLDTVQFHGWIPREQMWRMFSSDCIVVIPSIYPDNFPNVVGEAMLCGAPVVASNAGGTCEWFVNGESGLSYNSLDVDHLTESLSRLIKEPALRKQLGDAARDRILKHHSPKSAAERYAEIYGKAISTEK